MKVKETAKKPYGICPASMTIWNADQTYNKKGILGSYALRNNMFDVGAMLLIAVIVFLTGGVGLVLKPAAVLLRGADPGAAGREQSAPVPAAESGQCLHLLHPVHLHLLPATGGAVPLLAAAAEGAEQPEKGGVRRSVWRTFSAMDL